jgi:hypothetical protein
MRFENRSICQRCMRAMRAVVSIEPNGSTPGLVAFLCAGCGATASLLIYLLTTRREVEHTPKRQRFDYLRHSATELG